MENNYDIIYDDGPWEIWVDGRKVWVQSDDFEHDVLLEINGDFYNVEQKVAYAKGIIEKLNIKKE